MSGPEEIKRLILQSREAARAHIEAVREQCPLTKDILREHISGYVLCKYMLKDVPADVRDFDELTERSLSASMKVSKDLVKEFDLARSCDGASSAMVKKVLLFLSIQKAFGIELPAEQTARLKTVDELSDLVWEALRGDGGWHDRLQE